MGNRWIERWIHVNRNFSQVQTIRYIHKPSRQNYLDSPSEEFRFRVGKVTFSGNSEGFTYDSYQIEQKFGVRRVTIQFTYILESPIFHLTINYEIPPDLPVIRKWLTIQNLTDSAFFVEDIEIESLAFFGEEADKLAIWGCDMSAVGQKPWAGGASEAFVVLQDRRSDRGVALGNESPGFLKHYQVYSDRATASIGLTPTMAVNGAEIRVPPEGSVNTPEVWTMLFQGNPQTVVRETLKQFVAHPLPCTKQAASQLPSITWTQINPEWHMPTQRLQGNLIAVDYDWNIADLDSLKQMSKGVHDRGGKFGIRLPIAEIDQAFVNNPTWKLKPIPGLHPLSGGKEKGKGRQGERETRREEDRETRGKLEEWKRDNSQSEASEIDQGNLVVYCVLSDYGYRLIQAVEELLEETGADLLIFDGPILGSQDSILKGCDVLGHAHYSRAESIGVIYRWLFEFADYLHREYPDLQLGITAAAYSVEQPDMACLAHFDLFFD